MLGPLGAMAGLPPFSGMFNSQQAAMNQQMAARQQAMQDAMNVRQWSQQMMNQQHYGPGSFMTVAPGTLTKKRKTVNTCTYCDRQTKNPDIEYGCNGCGAMEWK